MLDALKMIFDSAYKFMNIRIPVYEYNFTLWQLFMLGIVVSLLFTLIWGIIGGGKDD